MTGLRNRLVVTEQAGEHHVSSVLLAEDEILPTLEWEEEAHRAGGWRVDNFGGMLRCEKGATVRWVWVRSKTPQDDTL
jgi:hypothetical protein